MERGYVIYSETIEKLREIGIGERINALNINTIPDIRGLDTQKEIRKTFGSKKGYKNFPRVFWDDYAQINKIIQNPEGYKWRIEKHDEMLEVPCNLEDALLFCGYPASLVLKSEEIGDYSKFGFSSPVEFIAAVGLYTFKEKCGGWRCKWDDEYWGYKWIREGEDGTKIETEITESFSGNLRIYQRDISEYQTTDPFGRKVGLRPLIRPFEGAIASFWSTEPTLLVAVMKYIHHQKIDVELLKDIDEILINWKTSLESRKEASTELYSQRDLETRLMFNYHEFPIPCLNEPKEPSHFLLPRDSHGNYEAYIASNGDLVFIQTDKLLIGYYSKKRIGIRFSPEESEELIKGLIYMHANGVRKESPLLNLMSPDSDSFESDFPSASLG